MHDQTAAVSRRGGGSETQRQCNGQGNPCAVPYEFHAKKVLGSPLKSLRLGNRCLTLCGTLLSRHLSTVSAGSHPATKFKGPQLLRTGNTVRSASRLPFDCQGFTGPPRDPGAQMTRLGKLDRGFVVDLLLGARTESHVFPCLFDHQSEIAKRGKFLLRWMRDARAGGAARTTCESRFTPENKKKNPFISPSPTQSITLSGVSFPSQGKQGAGGGTRESSPPYTPPPPLSPHEHDRQKGRRIG